MPGHAALLMGEPKDFVRTFVGANTAIALLLAAPSEAGILYDYGDAAGRAGLHLAARRSGCTGPRALSH